MNFSSLFRHLAMQRQFTTITLVDLASSFKLTTRKMAWYMGKYSLSSLWYIVFILLINYLKRPHKIVVYHGPEVKFNGTIFNPGKALLIRMSIHLLIL